MEEAGTLETLVIILQTTWRPVIAHADSCRVRHAYLSSGVRLETALDVEISAIREAHMLLIGSHYVAIM
jgi:hypothetical protein